MRDMIEMAIEREAELLDATLEFPEILELPVFPWSNTQSARKFSARGVSRRRFSARPATRTQYVN
jgi:hypothetical protein